MARRYDHSVYHKTGYLFNVLQTIEVEGNIERGRQNIPYHIKYGDNHNFILIGESRRSGIAGFDTADLRSISEELEISIIDITGSQLRKLTISEIREGFQYFLPLDQLVPGTYFLNIFTKRENVIEQHKFIYQ